MHTVSNGEMPKHHRGTTEGAVFTYFCAASDTDASRHRSMCPNVAIVSNLNLVVEFNTLFNHGIAQGSAVYTGIGTNLDIVTDYYTSCLRYF